MEDAQRQIEQLNLRLATLNAISKSVTSSSNLNETLRIIIDNISELPGLDSCRIYLLDNRKVLKLAAQKGLSVNFINKPFIKSRKAGDGFLGQTILDGKTIVVDDIRQCDSPYADVLLKEGLQSYIYLPLINKEAIMGVICLSSRTSRQFSSELIEFLVTVGNCIVIAVDNNNLYENIKAAYRDLKEAQEQVVWAEKMASLGKLAATIAHEINNPLAGVLNYIRLIIKQTARNNFSHEKLDKIRSYLEIIDSEIARCGEIVKDLLAFARRTKITVERNNIEDILNKTLSLISHDLEMKDIQLHKTIEPNLPKFECDFRQIQQALLNLMYNAAEAMPSGGTLTITANRATGSKSLLEIVVSDTGCGIAEGELDHIFEPFFTTKEEGKGVGLGLSVTYGIITKHDGTITVESKLGKGSSFIIHLPFK